MKWVKQVLFKIHMAEQCTPLQMIIALHGLHRVYISACNTTDSMTVVSDVISSEPTVIYGGANVSGKQVMYLYMVTN